MISERIRIILSMMPKMPPQARREFAGLDDEEILYSVATHSIRSIPNLDLGDKEVAKTAVLITHSLRELGFHR